MEVINLNLIPNGTNPVVHVSQYDEGRDFRFNLFDGTSVLTLDGTETIECDVKKPDGNIVTVAVPNTSDSYIVVTTTLQMTACGGNSLGTIKISKGGVNLYTLNFVLYCERSPLENGIESESSIHNLEEQIAEAVADQYDADSVIFDNTPTQGHGIGFAVTSEGVATAVQDAKDYTDTAIGGLSIPDELNDLADVTITTPSNGEILVYNNGSWENQANPASTTNFAPDYDDTATYNTNDKVIYQGLLYVCLEDSVTGAWDNTKWQQISVADLNAELLPITSGSATNTKDYIDTALSGKADKTALTLNVNNVLDSLTTDLRLVVGTIQMGFSSGTATSSISTFLPSGYSFTTIAFACAKSTGSVDITGAEVSGTNLTVRTTQTGVVTVDINFLVFARKT